MKREGDRAALGAVEDDVVDLLGQVLPRRLQAEAELARRGCRAPACNKGEGGLELGPGDDRALLDAERLVGDDQLRIEQLLLAEPVAARAGALRRVEAEQPRLDLGDGEAGDRAGEFLGEDDAAGGGVGGEDVALGAPRAPGAASGRGRGGAWRRDRSEVRGLGPPPPAPPLKGEGLG